MADSDILRGAIQAAAGQTLGLTQDQVLDLKRQQLREQQRENRGRRAERAGNKQQAEDFLADDTRRFESIGGYQEQERYPDPFGIERSAADVDGPGFDMSQEGFDSQRGGYVIVDSGKGKQRMWRERGQLVSDPKFAKDKGPDMADPFVKPTVSPQAAGMGGPNGLATQLADMVGRGEIDPNSLVPGSSTKTIGRLIQEMAMEADPSLQIEAARIEAGKAKAGFTPEEIQQKAALEARIAASPQGENIRGITGLGGVDSPFTGLTDSDVNAIRQEAISRSIKRGAQPGGPSRGFDSNVELTETPIIAERIARANVNDPAARAISDARAGREAASYITSSDGYFGDINRVDSLGLASKKFNKGVPMDQFNVVQAVDPNTFSDAIEMVGPDGITVGYSDDTDKWVADVNLASPESATNAPTSRTATWMEGNLPGFGREGGTSFGARSVNPGDELEMLNQRLGQFGSAKGIRGIDDLEQAVRAVTVDAAFRGATMWNFDPSSGKKVAVRDPGLDEVLYGLDYTADEKTRLAQALQTVEASQRSPVNSLQKALFAEGLSSESTGDIGRGFEKDVQLARITNERVGRDNKKTGEKRVSVRKGLRELDASPGRVFSGRDPNTVFATAEDGSRVLLPEAQQDLIDARAAQGDSQRPFQAAPQGQQPERARFLAKKAVGMTPDERIKAYGAERGGIANRLEGIRQEIDARRGQQSTAVDPIAAEFRARDAEFAASGAARRSADSEAQKLLLAGGNPVNTEFAPGRQRATSAVTNPATDPTPLLDRGTWMGSSGSGRVVNPWASATPEPTGERRMTNEMKNELAGLNSGATQGPRSPGIRDTIMNSIKRAPTNFAGAPTRQRAGAAIGAGLLGATGLSALIGGERDNRDQEVYR